MKCDPGSLFLSTKCTCAVFQSGPMRGGFGQYSGLGPGEPRRVL